MKTKTSLLLSLIVLLMIGCSKEELIVPSGNYKVIRHEFPQGNNSWDMEIKEIYDKYGVYLLYKDVTVLDLNRQWQSLGTGKLYSGTEPEGEEVLFYVDYLKNAIFSNITPEMARTALPLKIYLLNDLKGLDPDEEDTGGTGGTGGTGPGGPGDPGTEIDPNFVPIKTDGFDYWAISFSKNELDNPDPRNMRIKSCTLLYLIIEGAIKSGVFIEPDSFKEGIDYVTPINNNKPADPNYYLNRGFINIVYRDFTPPYNMWELPVESTPWVIGDFTDRPINPDDMPYPDFFSYIRAALYYSESQFKAKYPENIFPLINRRYEAVVEYFLSEGIDLKNFSAIWAI